MPLYSKNCQTPERVKVQQKIWQKSIFADVFKSMHNQNKRKTQPERIIFNQYHSIQSYKAYINFIYKKKNISGTP